MEQQARTTYGSPLVTIWDPSLCLSSTFSLTMFNLASGPISIAIRIVKHMINVEYFLFRYLNRPPTQTVLGICLGARG